MTGTTLYFTLPLASVTIILVLNGLGIPALFIRRWRFRRFVKELRRDLVIDQTKNRGS